MAAGSVLSSSAGPGWETQCYCDRGKRAVRCSAQCSALPSTSLQPQHQRCSKYVYRYVGRASCVPPPVNTKFIPACYRARYSVFYFYALTNKRIVQSTVMHIIRKTFIIISERKFYVFCYRKLPFLSNDPLTSRTRYNHGFI